MKFSIITVSYNSAKTIQQTIESVLSQNYTNLEYIVIDGASQDGTLKILENYKERIKYISEPDKGIYDAMNKGIKIATGDFIGTIGSDDFYPNTQVISDVAAYLTKTKSDSLYGDIQFVNPGNESKIVRNWKAGEYNIKKWLHGWMPPHPTFYIKKNIIINLGGFNTTFKCSGDYELMLRILYKNKISTTYLPQILMTMRNGGTSTATYKHRLTANKEDRLAWKLNNIKPRFYTLFWKPISKISQIF
ncbi:MAG: glycosyltransferase [Pseudarcicella sp.]|nr:glycosyltransferase [Pseudarcicella sp.]MBP6410921.1 glycosyltransferase [Pseudarcicella sp.]